MAEQNENQGTQEVKTIKKHKTLGEYKKVIVEWREIHKQNLNVFVSINGYTATFKPETEVMLPEKVIDFLKLATYEEHYFDKEDKKHKSRSKKKYLIEVL